jgi:predicted transcriptional regulator YdeE
MKTNSEGTACLYMNYNGGRVAQLSLTADTLLYSTPKQLEMRFTPQGDLINRIDLGFITYNNIEANYACVELTPDQPMSINIDIDSLFNVTNDMAIFPIKLKNISFSLNTKAEKKEYNIPFEGIYLHYNQKENTNIKDRLEMYHLTTGTYAAFQTEAGGLAWEEFPKVFELIFESWLPASGYTQKVDTIIELYHLWTDKEERKKKRYYEVWVPVEKSLFDSEQLGHHVLPIENRTENREPFFLIC